MKDIRRRLNEAERKAKPEEPTTWLIVWTHEDENGQKRVDLGPDHPDTGMLWSEYEKREHEAGNHIIKMSWGDPEEN